MSAQRIENKTFYKSYKERVLSNPKTSLIASFIAWKLLLLVVALSSPGPGYDTSTTLVLSADDYTRKANETLLERLVIRLVRWDAIYFTQIARRGYLHEQEWAFGWGFTRVLAWICRGVNALGIGGRVSIEALAGILVAHLSHLLSVLVLHDLSRTLFETHSGLRASEFTFISAFLHIITPAGMFLSAPYAESLFSLFQFSAFNVYVRSIQAHESDATVLRDVEVIASGVLIGLATTVRSNGILGGLIFAYDAVMTALKIFATRNFTLIPKLVATGYAGLLVALGAAIPQFLAYVDYCLQASAEERRPWCRQLVPSIYGWVQDHYWNVGFLRYWTLSNMPLFFLAAPMLLIMAYSSIWGWTVLMQPAQSSIDRKTGVASKDEILRVKMHNVLQILCVIQMMLAVLSLSSYHVQIITRLSSGYPVWYWWLSSAIINNGQVERPRARWSNPILVVRWMVMYTLIQGGLFSGFLPPA